MSDRPTTGIFIAWDEEEVAVERRGAGTMQDRTVVTGRRTVTRQALWANKISDRDIASAERYVEAHKDDHDNFRVQVFKGGPDGTR